MPCEPTLDAVKRMTIDDLSPSNLGSKAPESFSSCTNLHGKLGQTTNDGNPVTDLYNR